MVQDKLQGPFHSSQCGKQNHTLHTQLPDELGQPLAKCSDYTLWGMKTSEQGTDEILV
jgi:hypothetical protein